MHECIDSFITNLGGKRRAVGVGQRLDDDDPVIKALPHLFRKVPKDPDAKPTKKRAAKKAAATPAGDSE